MQFPMAPGMAEIGGSRRSNGRPALNRTVGGGCLHNRRERYVLEHAKCGPALGRIALLTLHHYWAIESRWKIGSDGIASRKEFCSGEFFRGILCRFRCE